MLIEGLVLMSVGMGTVFSFLVILWFAVVIMSKIVIRLNELYPEQVAKVTSAVNTVKDNVEIAIAIAAAKNRK